MTEPEIEETSAARARAALDEHLAATAELHLERLKAGYSEDALLQALEGEIRGRDAIGAWFSNLADFFSSLALRFERIETREGFAAIEWWASRGAEQPPLVGRDEFVLDADGLITEQRVAFVRKAKRDPHYVRLELEPPLARLVLDRDEKRNAVSLPMLGTMKAALAEVADNPEVRALVLFGEGRSFSAGEDVRGFDFPDIMTAAKFLDGPLDFFTALENLPKPVVIAVHGHAFGFGSEALLVADAVYTSPDAVFGFAEIDHGAVPSVLVTRGLNVVFRRRALDLALSGRRIDANAALEARLVHAVVNDPVAAAEAAARQMAAWSPEAVALVKGLLGHGAAEDHARAKEFMPKVLTQVKVAI